MKRMISLLLCSMLLLCLFGCGQTQEKLVDPISFYYLHAPVNHQIQHGTEHSVITPEIREGLGVRRNISALLAQYLSGPKAESYVSPLPADTKLVDWTTEDTTLCITFSDEISDLTGIDLTLACACVAKTILEIGNFDTVKIQAETLPLDGKTSITMDKNNMLLLDDVNPNTEPNSN